MGHLFVLNGDLHRLDCDGWLLPTDAQLRIEPWAEPALRAVGCPTASDAPPGWPDTRRTLRVDRPDGPPVWLTAVGADHAMPVPWYIDGVRAFVEDAAEHVGTTPDRAGPSGREPGRACPLLGLPIVATGEGGMREHPDRVLLDLVPALSELADESSVDLALVTPDRLAYDAAQATRRRLGGLEALFPDELSGEALAVVHDLADAVTDGQLGLFVGAGVSMGAGLPGWRDLLIAVARYLEDDEIVGELKAVVDEGPMEPLDVASLLAARLGGGDEGAEALRQAVADMVSSVQRHALAHSLLASLAVPQTITTNYDALFEHAAAGAHRRLAVLPYQRPRADQPWLLKLHGDVRRRQDIVLTRQDFLRYAADRNALTGVVHALLLTQHLLFVGYSLSDPNFHRIIDEVRRALHRAGERGDHPVGTVLVAAEPHHAVRELWGRDLTVTAPSKDVTGAAAYRLHDILLDALGMLASDPDAHLMSPRFAGLLDAQQAAVRDALQPLAEALTSGELEGSAVQRIGALLATLGHRPR